MKHAEQCDPGCSLQEDRAIQQYCEIIEKVSAVYCVVMHVLKHQPVTSDNQSARRIGPL